MFKFDMTNCRDRLRNEAPLIKPECSDAPLAAAVAADRQRSPYSLILR